MKRVYQTLVIKQPHKLKKLLCFLIGHKITTNDISESMWRDREYHSCSRCKKEWMEAGFLRQD